MFARSAAQGPRITRALSSARVATRTVVRPSVRFSSTNSAAPAPGPASGYGTVGAVALLGAAALWWNMKPRHGHEEHPKETAQHEASTSLIPTGPTMPVVHDVEGKLLAEKKAKEMAPLILDTSAPIGRRMEAYVRNLQLQIVDALEALEGPDGGRFVRDHWKREEGGEGISCALQGGKVFEKAGVLVSAVHGPVPNGLRQHMNSRLGTSFGTGPLRMFATGVSLVIHPHNPLTPTSHANYRYIELVDENDKVVCSWFGGGSDLTPAYLIEEDAVHFHKVIKGACDQHDKSIYPKFKKWCDDYFNNVHRGEHRGIGGIFFDDVNVETMKGKSQEQIFAFVRSCGNSFVPQYIPIVQKRMNTEFTPEQKVWQQLRRGQYVEFNLVHDRGTKFGLATPGARIESILMSMPLTARWQYKVQPEAGSEEEKLLEVLRNPREWV